MLIKTDRKGDVTILRLHGSLGLLDEGDMELTREVMHLLASQRHILLDLGGITNIDSSGIRVIISILEVLRNMDGDLALLHPTARAWELLQRTGLIAAIRIFDNETEAIASFTRPR